MANGSNTTPQQSESENFLSVEDIFQSSGNNSSGNNTGGNNTGGIANDNTQSSNKNEDMSQISNDMDDEIPF